jgi:hypothetical protein
MEHPRRWKAIGRCSLGQAIDPELVRWVWPDDGQTAQLLGQIGRARGMVQVTVGDPDLLKLEFVRLNRRQNQVQITPRVNHSRLARLVVPDQGAVLLEGRDRDGLVLQHGGIICGVQSPSVSAF